VGFAVVVCSGLLYAVYVYVEAAEEDLTVGCSRREEAEIDGNMRKVARNRHLGTIDKVSVLRAFCGTRYRLRTELGMKWEVACCRLFGKTRTCLQEGSKELVQTLIVPLQAGIVHFR
jgi:hypothetical protein